MLGVLPEIIETLRVQVAFRRTKLLLKLLEIVLADGFADETNRVFALILKMLVANACDTIVNLCALKRLKWPNNLRHQCEYLLLFECFGIYEQ